MVEMHYAEDVIVVAPDGREVMETHHWRIVLNDEDAALAQAAQDVAEGRNPVRIVKRPRTDPWDYRRDYDEAKWETIVPQARLRQHAESQGGAFE